MKPRGDGLVSSASSSSPPPFGETNVWLWLRWSALRGACMFCSPSRGTFHYAMQLAAVNPRPGTRRKFFVVDVRRIDVLSDSTGETAEKVVRAAMLQFPHSGAQIRLHTRVRTKEAARPVLERAAKEGALVVFTVVSPELREFIHSLSYELKVEALDLIGSLIGKLSVYLDRQPINLPSP